MRRKKAQRLRIQKRPFLLFELLLSMGLLLLCLSPLIKTHVGMHRADLEQIHKLEAEIDVHNAYCKMKEALFSQNYTWEQLMGGVEVGGFTLCKVDQSTKHDQESGLLLKALYELNDQEYERRVYVEKARSHTR